MHKSNRNFKGGNKLKKAIAVTLFVMLISNLIFIPSANCADLEIEKADIYSKGYYDDLLKYNGMDLPFYYVVYEKNGVEYPAYCVNRGVDGVGELDGYTVNVDELISNVMLWRVITNGYPYKTVAELGCKTKEEAYLATRQAVYCVVGGRDVENFTAGSGEAGKRTLNALKQIINNANKSTQTKVSSDLKMSQVDTKWKIDDIDSNYISKEFKVTSERTNEHIQSFFK